MEKRNRIIREVFIRKVTKIIVSYDRTHKFSSKDIQDNKENVEKMYRNFQLFVKKVRTVDNPSMFKRDIAYLQKSLFKRKKVKIFDGDIGKYKFDITRNQVLIYIDNIERINNYLEKFIKEN